MKISLIEAPACGNGASDALCRAASEVLKERAELFPCSSPASGSPDRTDAVCAEIADATGKALCAGKFPLIVGGDRSASAGALAGAGNVYGEDLLAAVCIGGYCGISSGNLRLRGENIFILGEGEYPPLRAQGVHLYTRAQLHQSGWEAALAGVMSKINRSEVRAVHLSFDARCVNTNGFSAEEALYVTATVLSSFKTRSADFMSDGGGQFSGILRDWFGLFCRLG